MPFTSEKTPIKGTKYDRRRKLTPDDKLEIIRLYPIIKSQRKLAQMYRVSRRLITFVLDPQKLIKNYQNRLKLGGSAIYYDKTKHTTAIRNHRRYKQKLKIQGKI